jgi:hypothetical protein
MKYSYKSTQRAATVINFMCLLLFVAYSCYIYLRYQYGVVALTYFVQSEQSFVSSTSNSTWISALLGTTLALIPALVIMRCMHFSVRFKALMFLPSYVVLGLLTGISPQSVYSTENTIPILSTVLLLLLSFLLIVFSQFYHERRNEHSSFFNYFWSNALLSSLGIFFTICITNTDRPLHVQLSMAHALHEEDYASIERISNGETSTNNTITAIQALALSKQDKIADNLFALPYLKGSASLFPDSNPASCLYHTPTLLYTHLRAVPVGRVGNVRLFLEKAVAQRQLSVLPTAADSVKNKPLIDYYLCSLLLDKDLKGFAANLSKYYSQSTTLPRHYREALSLYYSLDIEEKRQFLDTEMDSLYNEYSKILHEHKNSLALRQKACVVACPHTYWNYYHFTNL